MKKGHLHHTFCMFVLRVPIILCRVKCYLLQWWSSIPRSSGARQIKMRNWVRTWSSVFEWEGMMFFRKKHICILITQTRNSFTSRKHTGMRTYYLFIMLFSVDITRSSNCVRICFKWKQNKGIIVWIYIFHSNWGGKLSCLILATNCGAGLRMFILEKATNDDKLQISASCWLLFIYLSFFPICC